MTPDHYLAAIYGFITGAALTLFTGFIAHAIKNHRARKINDDLTEWY